MILVMCVVASSSWSGLEQSVSLHSILLLLIEYLRIFLLVLLELVVQLLVLLLMLHDVPHYPLVVY